MTESKKKKKKLQGTKESEHCTVIYSGVDRHTRGQPGVVIWIHKSISNKIDNYKFWKDRVIETRLKTQRRHLTILAVCAPTDGRDELNEECFETLQHVLDKVNKNDYIMFIGDVNARAGNNRFANIVGANGEAALKSNGRKMIDLRTINNLKIMNTFLSTNKSINLLGKQEKANQLLITV
jgi:hypothetical protein